MNPEKIGNQIVKSILLEEVVEKVALYPGAFKPPHKGHVATALRAKEGDIDRVIIFMSTKERDGVSAEQAQKVWDLYKQNNPELENVEIVQTPTPVKDVYDYAKDNPANLVRAVFGKGEEERFKSLLDKEKYPHVEVFDAGMEGTYSATELRRAIRDNDLETISEFIPQGINVDDFMSIFQTNEGLYPKYNSKKVQQTRYKASDVWTNDPDIQENYVLQDLENQYNIDLDLYDNGKHLTLSRISIPKDKRGQGLGSKVMNHIIQYADKVNKPIYLTPTKDFGATSVSRLEQFYKQFGFKKKDKSDFSARETMVRMPLNEADPKKGTGKKPKGSGRRLYTDEDPSDTVGVKFSSRQDIVDTFNKASFKAKSHARQSQIINLVHQRVRAAYNRAKDPLVKARLKKALEYAEQRKEASKKKTQRMKKEDRYLQEARYKKFLNEGWDNSKGKVIGDFVNYVSEYLSINKPKIKLINQPDYTQEYHSFGGYLPSEEKIMVVVHNRNMADILRTVAHEMVHHMQNLDNRLTPTSGEDGSPDENEANSLAAVIMRKFGRENPHIYE